MWSAFHISRRLLACFFLNHELGSIGASFVWEEKSRYPSPGRRGSRILRWRSRPRRTVRPSVWNTSSASGVTLLWSAHSDCGSVVFRASSSTRFARSRSCWLSSQRNVIDLVIGGKCLWIKGQLPVRHRDRRGLPPSSESFVRELRPEGGSKWSPTWRPSGGSYPAPGRPIDAGPALPSADPCRTRRPPRIWFSKSTQVGWKRGSVKSSSTTWNLKLNVPFPSCTL